MCIRDRTSTLGRTWRAKLPKPLRICRPGAQHGSTRRARCAPGSLAKPMRFAPAVSRPRALSSSRHRLRAAHGPEEVVNGLIADPAAAHDSLLNRLPEVEADQDARDAVLGRRLREAEEGAEHGLSLIHISEPTRLLS